MGTPHSSITDEDTLLRHNQVLYSCASIAVQKQVSRLPRRDVCQLASLAVAFEQIAVIPVLSVFEFANSRSGMSRLFGKRSKVRRGGQATAMVTLSGCESDVLALAQAIVDEQLATISSHAERLLGVHLSHSELCKLPLPKNNTYSARDFFVPCSKNWLVCDFGEPPALHRFSG
jgi:hypothetical protein